MVEDAITDEVAGFNPFKGSGSGQRPASQEEVQAHPRLQL
jgi:hypothetical protein